MTQKTAIIFGAGPAGLTAAYELATSTDIKPIIYEMTADIGGIAKTINYKGNRMDVGGHRFFSKSERVMRWWENIFPVQGSPAKDDIILERNLPFSKKPNAPNPEKTDKVMLIRNRISQIFFIRKFFDYPISLNFNTFLNLGLRRVFKIAISYLQIRFFPIKEEKSLRDFFINRFGKELYKTFFENYTEKVWGLPCEKINVEWGIQRVKGLSITKAVLDAVRNAIIKDASIDQKGEETSLIRQFMYPKLGPGQLWEEVAKIVKEKDGEIHLNRKIVGIECQDNKIIGVRIRDEITGNLTSMQGDYFFSSLPVKALMEAFGDRAPEEVCQVAGGLIYRDFITVGLLLKRLKIKNEAKIKTINDIPPYSWIYIQEYDVRLGRIQIYNNWSPYLLKDQDTVWLGLEYFCSAGDSLWNKPDKEFTEFAIDELVKIGFIEREDVIDCVLVKMPKAYPAYFGTYDKFNMVRSFTDSFENLFLIGRNGMHRYNNMDHSMLSAMKAVENIIMNVTSKDNIWNINVEKDYQE